MQLVGVQHDIVWEDKSATFDRVRRLLDDRELAPKALVVLPEMFATGFSMNVAAIAEAEDGPTHRFAAELAQGRGVYVMIGVVTIAPNGQGRNQCVVIDPTGATIARYTKMQPFSLGGESQTYEAGPSPLCFAWGEINVAPFICYDLRFPELFRHAVRCGAQLFTVIANWPEARDAHWLALLRARAIENQAYVIGVNRIGRDPKLMHLGHSLIVGPDGATLAAADSGEEALTVEVDATTVDRYRQKLPFLRDIRSDQFPSV